MKKKHSLATKATKIQPAAGHKILCRKIAGIIKNNRHFLICAHDGMDGDSLGSGLALGLALTGMGKSVYFLLTSPIPRRYKFLPGIKTLGTIKPDWHKLQVLFVLDTAGWGQIAGRIQESFRGSHIINIDHHTDNHRFGSINWVNTKASAVGEQIYFLLKNMKIPVTKNIAACLYVSILTDTGRFQFSNTTSVTHQIAAALIKTGVNPGRMAAQIYESAPPARLKLLRSALDTLQYEHGNQIIWMQITRQMLAKTGAAREDIEGFIDELKAVAGVKVALIFKQEANKKDIRITFRSKTPRIQVNKIAHFFNGGGHPAAAGCTVTGNMNKIIRKVLQVTAKAISEQETGH